MKIGVKKLRHTAAALLGAFVGRNNDYEGLWALGLLYNEARGSSNMVELDLVSGRSQPETPVSTAVARTFAGHLRRGLKRHGFQVDALDMASLAIVFGLPTAPLPRCHGGIGEPFLCCVTLAARGGRIVLLQHAGHCAPQDQFHGSRRAPGYASGHAAS